MRTFSLFALSCCLPTIALAWESDTQSVAFEVDSILHEGNEVETQIGWSALNLKFIANTDTNLHMTMDSESDLTWDADSTQLSQNWGGVEYGTEIELVQDLELDLTATLDTSGIPIIGGGVYTYHIYTWETSFDGAEYADSVLLDGFAANLVRVAFSGDTLLEVEFSLPFSDGAYKASFGINVTPQSYADISGVSITTDGRETTHKNDAIAVNIPANNDGEVELKSIWRGLANAEFALNITPGVTLLSVDETTGAESSVFSFEPFEYDWDLASGAYDLESDDADYIHNLPAITTDLDSLDFGSLLVGQTTTLEFDVGNLGSVDLEGTGTVQGGGFEIIQGEFTATNWDDGVISIAFTPDAVDTFTGLLTIASNDPSNPVYEVPLSGKGIAEGEGGEGEGGSVRGCGCNSSTPGQAGFLVLLTLFGLIARRRQTI